MTRSNAIIRRYSREVQAAKLTPLGEKPVGGFLRHAAVGLAMGLTACSSSTNGDDGAGAGTSNASGASGSMSPDHAGHGGATAGASAMAGAGGKATAGGAAGAGGKASTGGTSGGGGKTTAGGSAGAGGKASTGGTSGGAGTSGATVGAGGSAAGTVGAGGAGGAGAGGAPRGATLPFLEYEAEDGVTNGTILGPSRLLGDIAAESSGRKSVRLDATKQYVRFTSQSAANSIVVRYVIPDSPTGTGIDATLSVYVNGVFEQKLALTSRYAWAYDDQTTLDSSNDPADGHPHHYFDEARALVGDIPVGATVTLQKDEDDTAAYYVIDLIDLEQVAPALTAPAGFLAITDPMCGAAPDDAQDDGPAIQKCLGTAKAGNMGVWIPPGRFLVATAQLSVPGVAVRGAGMWRSTLYGAQASLKCAGDGCQFSDFSIYGETIARTAAYMPDNGFNAAAGSGTRLDNIWIEHVRSGYFVDGGTGAGTSGLVIHGCRVRDTYSNGFDFFRGVSDSLVEQSHIRNTGDDALAGSSRVGGNPAAPNKGNIFRFNTVQIPWRANCFAIYGGTDTTVEDNVCADTVSDPGILVAQEFNVYPFAGTVAVSRNTLLRAGGGKNGSQHGAFELYAKDAPVTGVVVQDLAIVQPTTSGVRIQGPMDVSSVSLTAVTIDQAATWGIEVSKDANGSASASGVVVTAPGSGGLSPVPSAWSFTKGPGDMGW